MRVVMFAPTNRSLYSRLVAQALNRQVGVDLLAIFVRKLWSPKRIRADLRREGPRLLQKIYTKLILPEAADQQGGESPLLSYASKHGVDEKNLVDFSRRHAIAYHQVADFNALSSAAELEKLSPDLIVFTGGGLIRKNILDIPSHGVLNCHSGLLPRYRGMDTLEWTILEAKGKTPKVGLTLHLMDVGVDTGPILRQHIEALRPGDSLDSVRARLEPQMVQLMSEGVRDLASGELRATEQEKSAGRQYFVIHPRLQAKAEIKLRSGWGA